MNKKYDLAERTVKFAEAIINFAQKIPRNVVTIPLISQLVASGTSIGSNYCEADCAESRRDFEHKLGISKKEARETKYWLQLIYVACPELKVEAKIIEQEAHELNLILISIIRNSRNNSANSEALEISN